MAAPLKPRGRLAELALVVTVTALVTLLAWRVFVALPRVGPAAKPGTCPSCK